MNEPFHPGEIAVQEQTGERDAAILNGRLIGDAIPPAATRFLADQQFTLLGWADANGDLWAGFLAGPRGFASTDESRRTLRLRLNDSAGALFATPPLAQIAVGDYLGTLFVELETRRRLRVNGRVADVNRDVLELSVEAAYALCPKYIQRRELTPSDQTRECAGVETGSVLRSDLTDWIESADTFFVASAHPDGPTDVSHRGGRPGFVRVQDAKLAIPDYSGNSMFNTLGNFLLNPLAGLIFLDFARNRQLQLTGDVALELEGGDAAETGGTGRRWWFTPRRYHIAPLNHAFDWRFIDASPFNP